MFVILRNTHSKYHTIGMAGSHFMLTMIPTGRQTQHCDKQYHCSTKMS